MWDVIKKMMAGGTTILLTTQYLEEAATNWQNKIAVINEGTIVANGTATELKKSVGNDRIEFIIAGKSSFTKALEAVKSSDAQVNKKQRTISVASHGGTKELYELLGRLQKAHIEVESVSLHKPTLDDVFFENDR